MNDRSTLNILATLLFLGTASMASAQDNPPEVATLEKAEGSVMVDKGKGYASTKSKVTLHEGDRLITLDNSSAEIVYDDGCRVTLKANNLIEIARKPGCKAIVAAVNSATIGVPAAATSSIVPVLLGIGTVVAVIVPDDKPISGQ
jgi:hypothetical protein